MVPIRTGHESIGRGNDIIHKKVHRLSLLTECFSKGKPGSRRIPIRADMADDGNAGSRHNEIPRFLIAHVFTHDGLLSL